MDNQAPKIAVIDDTPIMFKSYALFLENHFDVVCYISDKIIKEDVFNWIISQRVECVIIDYDLKSLAQFDGVELAYYINEKIYDFPCILLTAYAEDAKRKELVNNVFIFNKETIEAEENDEEFINFIGTLNNAIKVFRNRILKKEEDYRVILNRIYAGNNLTNSEIETFVSLNRILKAYGIIEEEIPAKVILDQKNVLQGINSLIDSIEKLIEKQT